MHEYPDVYADGYSLSFGPYGCTLTLLRSEPPLDAPGGHVPSEVVARVRLSAPLARAIADALSQAVSQIPTNGSAPAEGTEAGVRR